MKEKKKLKNIVKYFKKLKEDLNKTKTILLMIQNIYLMKSLKKTITNKQKLKSTFNGNYIEYESRGDNDNLSLEEYLNTIRPCLRDMIDNYKAHSEWKIRLIMRIIFVSSIDANEVHIMHTKSDNIEIMIGIENNDVINELFSSFLR